MKPKVTDSHHDSLVKRLKDPKYALGYLNACLDDGDEGVFLLGLRYVAEAHGGLRKLSKKTRLNREHLFRLLSKTGNPRLCSLQNLIAAFGWKITLIQKSRQNLRIAA